MSEIKYMLGRIKGSLDIAEGNIIEFEDIGIETIQNKAQRRNDKTNKKSVSVRNKKTLES